MEDSFYTESDLRRLFRLTTHGKKRVLQQKDRDERETVEQTLDGRTLRILYELTRKKVLYKLEGPIGSGKESKIFLGRDYGGNAVAVKIFLTSTAEFKKRLPYIIGDKRFEGMKRSGYRLILLWAKKEYVNLRTAYDNGVDVPKPIMVLGNVLVMEFIGINGKKAPLLLETKSTKTDYIKVLRAIRRLYLKANLVHADLSEHNIFKLGSRICLFDFGSAVEVSHPNALEFLIRDIRNINRFFKRNGVEVFDENRILRGINKRWL
ncbi:MAG: serine protein kinase RIO [Nitrososphaeria archaeon]